MGPEDQNRGRIVAQIDALTMFVRAGRESLGLNVPCVEEEVKRLGHIEGCVQHYFTQASAHELRI